MYNELRNSSYLKMDLFCASNVGNAKYVHLLFIKIMYYLICPGLKQANYGA